MHTLDRRYTVARKPGTRLLLGRNRSGQLSFGGMGPDTLMVAPGQFEAEMRALSIPKASVVETPVTAHYQVG